MVKHRVVLSADDRQRPGFPPRRKLSDVREAQVLALAQSDIALTGS